MSDVLAKIAERVRARIEEDKSRVSPAKLMARVPARRCIDFRALFASGGTRVIAEVKLASPSEGDIAPGMDPLVAASDYLKNGATALSILTERDFFKGKLEYLERIRAAHPNAALLMKDFIVDEYQLYQGLHAGADAVLLILALLGGPRARELHKKAQALGLTPLVEVHDEDEMREAIDMKAPLVGVNNRSLKTLQVSLGVSETLARLAPAGSARTLIAESGLKTGADLKRLHACGFSGFLIGTHFMKSGQPGSALKQLIQEAGA